MQARHIPNLISATRIACVPVLIGLAVAGEQRAFAWLILVAGLSDIVDGMLARRYGWTSRLGSILDSVADVVLTLSAIVGLWFFFREELAAQWPVFLAIIVTWAVVHLAAVLRYGKTASFHTALTRAGLFAFGLFVMLMLFHGFVPWFFYLTASLCLLAGIENLAMIALEPRWQPDQRGGLVALLKRRARAAATKEST